MKHTCKLYLADDCGHSNRVSVSAGVGSAPIDSSTLSYEVTAVVPKGPWRDADVSQMDDLIATDQHCDLRDNLAVVKLDQNTIDLAMKINVQDVASFSDLEGIIRSDVYAYNDFLTSMCDFYTRFEATNARRHKIGFDIGAPNQETTTINRAVNLKTGMHVDIWDQYDLHSAQEATNRICVNLGREDRYFLYVDMTLAQILEKITAHAQFDTRTHKQSRLVQTFFKLYPEYPVLRVKVSPFEAYIAPTENLIHDGSTLGTKSWDLTYTVRSDFRLL
jgi:hypothetical protein